MVSLAKQMGAIVLSLIMMACSDPSHQKQFGDVGGGLTNFGAACEKHGGLEDYVVKTKKVFIYCKNGRKLTYTNF